MTRYTLAGAWKAEADPQGEWVLFRDVRQAIETCGELAVERDRLKVQVDAYRSALLDIASVPLTLPNAQEGVKAARAALKEAA